jgi:RimJ/RimL family protein N-acetyltransferase
VTVVIERVVPNRLWHALDDDQVAGRAHLRRRPDGRAFVAADAWLEPVARALLDAVAADVPGGLHTLADERDADQLALLAAAGYVELRREDEYVIPVASALAATAGPVPPGLAIVPADEKESDRLARLDERIRQDVPGSDGWVNDPAEFRDYTFDEHFDPRLYLVAVVDGEYAGLVRVWRGTRVPRLGLLGVLRWHRRRGLARALLHAAFAPLAERGIELVSAEADATNGPSRTLLHSLGARRTGGTIELHRPT